MVREFLALFKKRATLCANTEVLRQAAVLAVPPPPRERVQAAFEGHVRFQRLSYAEEQAKWEWEHNKAARDAYQRAKDGFF